MSLPTLDQYKQGATTWKREHKGIFFTLSHHGVSEHSSQGTWCFYVHLLEPMFISKDDFALFDREPEIKELSKGSFYETYDYGSVPDYGFHGGITFYERNFYTDKNGNKQKALKIGCDYAHLWDEESGYWQGLEDVEQDAKLLIDEIVKAHPMKLKCGYCGRIDMPENFYEAENGRTIHKSQIEALKESGWTSWLPKEKDEWIPIHKIIISKKVKK